MDREPALVAMGHDFDLGAEGFEHPLGVVARRHGLDDGGDARRIEARKKDCRFDLSGGHREFIGDGHGARGTRQRQRQATAFARLKRRAHESERCRHAAHRAFGQRRVADKGRGDRMACHKPHDEAGASAGIAEIQRFVGGLQAADTDAGDAPDGLAVGVRFACHTRPEAAHGLGGRQHIIAFQKSRNHRFADC